MKAEIIWWISFGLLSTLIIGIVTGFKFSLLDIQLHDTYYVFQSFDAIKLLTLILGIGRYFYLVTDIIAGRYAILALIISIVNPMVALFVLIGIYFSIETIVTFTRMYPGIDLSAHFLLPAIFSGLLAVQAIVEVKMIGKLRAVLAGK